jgi:hypothetical protein
VCLPLIYYSDPMNRAEFEQLRDLPDKRIEGNIIFSLPGGSKPIHIITPLPVQNALGIDLVLQGSYNAEIRKLTVQFLVRGIGPICRLCINGRLHRALGRTHKHDLHDEDDPGKNLPQAVSRTDLSGPPLETVWRTICKQAKILHNGSFDLPSGGAQ